MKKNIPFWTVPPITVVPAEGAAVVGGNIKAPGCLREELSVLGAVVVLPVVLWIKHEK